MNKNKQQWYKQTKEQTLGALKSSAIGLSVQEVKKRQETYGTNELPSGKGTSAWQIFIGQFKDVLIIVLLVAASISMVLSLVEEQKLGTESLLIYAIVIAIAVVGFFNEYRAEKTVESLKGLLAFRAKVRRDGHVVEIDAMPDPAANSMSIAFGDFKRGYLIVDRMGVRILRDPYSAKPYVLFYTTKRVGGGIADFDAIKLLKFGVS